MYSTYKRSVRLCVVDRVRPVVSRGW